MFVYTNVAYFHDKHELILEQCEMDLFEFVE